MAVNDPGDMITKKIQTRIQKRTHRNWEREARRKCSKNSIVCHLTYLPAQLRRQVCIVKLWLVTCICRHPTHPSLANSKWYCPWYGRRNKKVDHPTGCWMNDNGTIRILRSNVLYTSEPMDVRWDGTACTWMGACMYPTGRFGLTILGKHPGKHATFWGFCQCVFLSFFFFFSTE